MSATSLIEPDSIKFKKIFNNINIKGKININHIILNRNNPIKNFNNQTNKKNIIKKDLIAPFKYNNLSSISILNKANDSLQKQKKIFKPWQPFSVIKSQLLYFFPSGLFYNKTITLRIMINNKNIVGSQPDVHLRPFCSKFNGIAQ